MAKTFTFTDVKFHKKPDYTIDPPKEKIGFKFSAALTLAIVKAMGPKVAGMLLNDDGGFRDCYDDLHLRFQMQAVQVDIQPKGELSANSTHFEVPEVRDLKVVEKKRGDSGLRLQLTMWFDQIPLELRSHLLLIGDAERQIKMVPRQAGIDLFNQQPEPEPQDDKQQALPGA